MQDVGDLVDVWSAYFAKLGSSWSRLIEGIEPRPSGCGDIYELDMPLDRPNESFAIADMRKLACAEPHLHINEEVEIYFALQGAGLVVIGTDEHEVGPGDVVVIPPDTVHYTVPHDSLVLGLVNTPPFDPGKYVLVHDLDDRYDYLSSRTIQREIADELRSLTVDLDAWAAVLLTLNEKGDLLICRSRYELPLDWGIHGNRLDSGSHNVRTYNAQVAMIDNNVDADQPPSDSTTRHRMTAAASVPMPGLGTVEVLADRDGYTFDAAKVERISNTAARIVELTAS